MSKRKSLALGTVLAMLLLVVWGAVIEPRLIDVQRQTAAVPHLPQAWEGRRVALIADLQVGMWLGNTGTIRRIVDRIVALDPALVLIAGDFVYHPAEDEREDVEAEEFRAFNDEVSRATGLVRPLAAHGIPVYAVLGNHDYGMAWPDSITNRALARNLEQSLEAAGVRVLNDEAVALAAPGSDGRAANPARALYLLGIDARYPGNGNDDVKAALDRIPDTAARLVLMHNPDSFESLPAHSAPLALAGHTHGGQIAIPFTPDWSLLSWLSADEVTADGWIEHYGQAGNRLYVNRGIGFSLLPLRIACRPELTLLTLTSPSESSANDAG